MAISFPSGVGTNQSMAVVPFVLSWLLKEVPLRTTLDHSAEVSSAQAPAGGGKVVASQFRSTEP